MARNEALRTSKYLGRAIWRRWSGHHRRSCVQSKMICIKLLGQSLMACNFDRQGAELQVRIAVLNGYTAFNIPATEATGKSTRGKGNCRQTPICATKPLALPNLGWGETGTIIAWNSQRPTKMTVISSIRNLGPAVETAFAKAGIYTAEEVRALGADKAYQRLIEAGTKPHFIGYYALVMGLQGRPWNDCQGLEKEALRKQFDQLKTVTKKKGRLDIEAALHEIGVIPKKEP